VVMNEYTSFCMLTSGLMIPGFLSGIFAMDVALLVVELDC
jgi:hypothetical protein